MQTPLVLEALDVLVPLLFVLFYFLGKIRKDTLKLLFRIWLVGLIFGFGWELWGTGDIWVYPNYSFYIYNGTPLALPFAWAWWFMICYLISRRLMRVIGYGTRGELLAYYLSGVWFANLESVAVAIGWWRYVYTPWFSRPWPLVSLINGSPVHIMVYLGWGILTLYSFLIALQLFDKLKKRWSEKVSHSLLIPPATILGTLSWFTIGFLTWVIEMFARTIVPF